jgi:hypothetical protein
MSYLESRELLNKFQILEQEHDLYLTNWVDVEDESVRYIWAIENFDDPRGFLSYKILALANVNEFIYIVKIYVLKDYRGKTPILIDDERVSQILFRQISVKDIDILTLESADEKLDKYYKSMGFEYNEEKSRIYSQIIDSKNRQIMVREINKEIPEEELRLFVASKNMNQ